MRVAHLQEGSPAPGGEKGGGGEGGSREEGRGGAGEGRGGKVHQQAGGVYGGEWREAIVRGT